VCYSRSIEGCWSLQGLAEPVLLLLIGIAAGVALAVVGVPHQHGSHLKTQGTESSSSSSQVVSALVLLLLRGIAAGVALAVVAALQQHGSHLRHTKGRQQQQQQQEPGTCGQLSCCCCC
jgi:flagellar biosynthesis component FlhA